MAEVYIFGVVVISWGPFLEFNIENISLAVHNPPTWLLREPIRKNIRVLFFGEISCFQIHHEGIAGKSSRHFGQRHTTDDCY